MARKKSFMESRGFKIFLKYLYGLGAAVVIAGALFKIMHWPFANEMLIAGMGTEVLVFFVSAFEPLHEELDWTRVYPELAEETKEDFLPIEEGEDGMSPEEALALAEQGMKDIEYDKLSIADEPIFLRDDDDSISLPSDMISLGYNDSVASRGSRKTKSSITLFGNIDIPM